MPEVAGFRVYFDEDGSWVQSPGFIKWAASETVDAQTVVAHEVSGQRKYQNITLKRGADTARADSAAVDFLKWRKHDDGRFVRKDLLIELVDGNDEVVGRYAFKQGFPIKWRGAVLNATSNEDAVEEVTLACEGLELT